MAYEYTRSNEIRESVAYLISYPIIMDENGVPQRGEPIKTEVLVQVGGVYQKEFYEAFAAGIKPQWQLTLSDVDYNNEEVVEFEGEIYSVYRSYFKPDRVELYLRKDTGTWE